jgi:hypothetical protein
MARRLTSGSSILILFVFVSCVPRFVGHTTHKNKLDKPLGVPGERQSIGILAHIQHFPSHRIDLSCDGDVVALL